MRVSRRDDTDPDSASDNNSVKGPLGSEDTTHNLFKQYFESHFEALPHLPRLKREHEHHTDDGASDENMGDWEGIIDDEGLDESVIIDQGNTAAQSAELPLSSKRFFMVNSSFSACERSFLKLLSEQQTTDFGGAAES